MARLHERLRRFGGSAFIAASLHDEILVECDEEDGEEILRLVEETMVEAMDELVNGSGPHVPIKVDGRVTKVWTKG